MSVISNLPDRNATSVFLTCQPSRIADLKLVFLGESSVGKSSIIQRFQNNTFSEGKASTIGAAFLSKKILRKETNSKTISLINLQVWDTAGQERFHNLTPLYYRNSNVALVVFDLTDSFSFQKAEYWINELKDYIEEGIEGERPQLKIILVGSKLDLLPLKPVSQELPPSERKLKASSFQPCSFNSQIESFIAAHSGVVCDKWFRTSSKLNIGIPELFDYILDTIDASLYHSYDEQNGRSSAAIDLHLNAKKASCQC